MKARFKIVSTFGPDGMPRTHLTDLETGKPVGLVQKIVWTATSTDPLPTCTVELLGVELDVEVEADIKKTGFVKYGFETNDAEFEKLCESIAEANKAPETKPAKKTKKAKK